LDAERLAREAADIIYKVFGMTQLRIKTQSSSFASELSNHLATNPSNPNVYFKLMIKYPTH